MIGDGAAVCKTWYYAKEGTFLMAGCCRWGLLRRIVSQVQLCNRAGTWFDHWRWGTAKYKKDSFRSKLQQTNYSGSKATGIRQCTARLSMSSWTSTIGLGQGTGVLCGGQGTVLGMMNENPSAWAFWGLLAPLSRALQPQISPYHDAASWQFNWALKVQFESLCFAPFHLRASLDW